MQVFSSSNSRVYSSRNYEKKPFLTIDCTRWGDELLNSLPAKSGVTADNSRMVEPENRSQSTRSFETVDNSSRVESEKQMEATSCLKPEVKPEGVQPENWPEAMGFSNPVTNHPALAVESEFHACAAPQVPNMECYLPDDHFAPHRPDVLSSAGTKVTCKRGEPVFHAKSQAKLPEFPPGVHTLVVMSNNDVFDGEWLDVVNNFLKLKLATDTGTYHCKGQTVYLNIDNIQSLV